MLNFVKFQVKNKQSYHIRPCRVRRNVSPEPLFATSRDSVFAEKLTTMIKIGIWIATQSLETTFLCDTTLR